MNVACVLKNQPIRLLTTVATCVCAIDVQQNYGTEMAPVHFVVRRFTMFFIFTNNDSFHINIQERAVRCNYTFKKKSHATFYNSFVYIRYFVKFRISHDDHL